MDIYFPAGATSSGKRPMVMMIHGGTFLNGDKSDIENDCDILADSGFVVASINYRLGWRDGTGQCDGDESSELEAGYRALQDANAAMRFLVANASQYGIDTGWVFVGGSSAGSISALNTAYIPNPIAMNYLPAEFALLGPVNNADNNLTNTFTIKGVCNMWGALPDSNLITPSSALPTISFHGSDDNVVPFDIGNIESCSNYIMLYGSACIQRRLQFFNKPAILNIVIGGGHGPAVYTPEFLMSNTACFFNRLIKSIPITSQVYTTLVSSCN
jgi:poly(3-hydroxybutyrate) depolymerase